MPAGAIAAAGARAVVAGVERGEEGVAVGLHDVDLSTGHAADLVGVAIEIRARGCVGVLPQRRHVQRRVAPAADAREVDREAQLLAEQGDRRVLLIAVRTALASSPEVGATPHLRLHARRRRAPQVARHDLHAARPLPGLVPSSLHYRDVAVAVDVGRALAGLRGLALGLDRDLRHHVALAAAARRRRRCR